MLVEKVLGKYEKGKPENRIIHRVLLDETGMQKRHQRTFSEDGMDVAITLRDDEVLSDGDVLYIDDTQIVVVEAKEEKVFVLRPQDYRQWAKACYNIGNMHQHAYLTQEEILVPYDPILETVIGKLKVPYRSEMRKLIGEKANISAGQHRHARTHGQVHHHEHEV